MKEEICGVDEAGRGPVIGPLVVAGVCVADDSEFKKMGVRDSKKLSPERREELAAEIREIARCKTVVLPAEDIDTLRKEMTLNEVETRLFVSILDELRPGIAYVDSADVDAKRFGDDIKKNLNFEITIISEHGADDTYPVVGAASIIAKTTRDQEIQRIEKEIGQSIGSGYPSDPDTIRFMENWIREKNDLPPCTRRSWETTRRIEQAAKTRKLEEFQR